MIVAITGYPNSGKSTVGNILASRTNLDLISTDQFIGQFTFAESPVKIIEAISDRKDYVIEGVTVARMLKYGFNQKSWKPDQVLWVVGGDQKNPISSSTFNAFKTWIDLSNGSYEIIWDISEY